MNLHEKSKFHVHCFLTDNGKQKHIRINRDSQNIGDDYILGVDIMGETGEKIGMDDFKAIARYLVEKVESVESCIIIPGEGELVKAHPIIIPNRASRRSHN